jgi:hypothetical protein
VQHLVEARAVRRIDSPLEELRIGHPLLGLVPEHEPRVLAHEGVAPQVVVKLPDDGVIEHVDQSTEVLLGLGRPGFEGGVGHRSLTRRCVEDHDRAARRCRLFIPPRLG